MLDARHDAKTSVSDRASHSHCAGARCLVCLCSLAYSGAATRNHEAVATKLQRVQERVQSRRGKCATSSSPLPYLTHLFAGGLRNRTNPPTKSESWYSGSRCVGTDPADRLAESDHRNARANFRFEGRAVLGSTPFSFAGAEARPCGRRRACCRPHQRRLALGSGDSLSAWHNVDDCASCAVVFRRCRHHRCFAA